MRPARSRPSRWLAVGVTCLGLALHLAAAPVARADSDFSGGLGLDRKMAFSLAHGRGERFGVDGSDWLLRFDVSALFLRTLFDNRAGIEFAMVFGYEDWPGLATEELGLVSGMPMAGELAIGFPFVVWERGTGDPGTLRLSFAPGTGISFLHAYGYVKARAAAVVLPGALDLDLTWQWTPMEASVAWSDEGLNLASLRLGAYFGGGDGGRWHACLELAQGNLETYAGDSLLAPKKRQRFEDVVRVGVGGAW